VVAELAMGSLRPTVAVTMEAMVELAARDLRTSWEWE
jgi:hypothetical protein